MKLLAPILALAILVAFAPEAPAVGEIPACVGYSWCYEATGNGFAVFCVKWKSNWVCGECEACGNEPWLP